MSAKRQKPLFSKLEKPSLTAWSLAYSGKNSVTKIGSFPFPRGPDSCFWKLKLSPCVQNTYGSFWFKNQNELQGRNFIQIAYFCDTISFENTKKYSILETFLGVLLSISPLFEQRFPPLELCATPPLYSIVPWVYMFLINYLYRRCYCFICKGH